MLTTISIKKGGIVSYHFDVHKDSSDRHLVGHCKVYLLFLIQL